MARQDVIKTGRAFVRIIESAQIILAAPLASTEGLLLGIVIALYQHRLRWIVANMPADITAEILAGSDAISGIRKNDASID